MIYNFVTSAHGGEGGTYNFMNNYYERGPNSNSSHFLTPYPHRTLYQDLKNNRHTFH